MSHRNRKSLLVSALITTADPDAELDIAGAHVRVPSATTTLEDDGVLEARLRLPGTVVEDCQYTSYSEVLSGLVVQAETVSTSGLAPLLEVMVRVWPSPVPPTIRTAPALRAPAVHVIPVGIVIDVAPPAEAVPVCLRRYTQQLWYSLVVIAEPRPRPANTPDVPADPSAVLVIVVGH